MPATSEFSRTPNVDTSRGTAGYWPSAFEAILSVCPFGSVDAGVIKAAVDSGLTIAISESCYYLETCAVICSTTIVAQRFPGDRLKLTPTGDLLIVFTTNHRMHCLSFSYSTYRQSYT